MGIGCYLTWMAALATPNQLRRAQYENTRGIQRSLFVSLGGSSLEPLPQGRESIADCQWYLSIDEIRSLRISWRLPGWVGKSSRTPKKLRSR